jgi:hypothetical protein
MRKTLTAAKKFSIMGKWKKLPFFLKGTFAGALPVVP